MSSVKGRPAAPAEGDPLSAHTPTCMVCGPQAPSGYHLEAVRRGTDGVEATFTFSEEHTGGPGLAHGGAVAAVCDDVLGHVLSVVQVPAVTRRLEVDYLRPVVLGDLHHLTARLTAREGRKLWIELEAATAEGDVSFTARGLFIRVGLDHFLARLSPQQQERARVLLAGMEDHGGEVSAP